MLRKDCKRIGGDLNHTYKRNKREHTRKRFKLERGVEDGRGVSVLND